MCKKIERDQASEAGAKRFQLKEQNAGNHICLTNNQYRYKNRNR